MRDPTYDIFRGAIGVDAVWPESVCGLNKARERMEQLAAVTPGIYFVYNAQSHSVLACADTRRSVWSFFRRNRKIA